jgi:hypothetical protein
MAGAAFGVPQPAVKNRVAGKTARMSGLTAPKKELRISEGQRWDRVRMSLCWLLQVLCHVIHRRKSQ